MDMSQIQARITELEARRARGESVPELDALYRKMDAMTDQGYRTATGEGKPKVQKKARGGMTGSASARADGCAQRGKTRGKMV
jgi:uncharacterized coiled-coil protein SlyX